MPKVSPCWQKCHRVGKNVSIVGFASFSKSNTVFNPTHAFWLTAFIQSALERDCDKKLWISCHDLSKYGKPHTNADTAPLGGRPVSALPTPPPPPCDYTGYDLDPQKSIQIVDGRVLKVPGLRVERAHRNDLPLRAVLGGTHCRVT